MQKLIKLLEVARQRPHWWWMTAALVLVVVGLVAWSGGHKPSAKTPLFTAQRGPLDITILEGGSLQALESQEIKCEVRVGYQGTKILKIVEEGYFVTEEDVRTNKVLVELDSSELQKQLVQEEIQYQSAAANLIDSEQNYEIQLNQNQSDIKDAEQKARFARMDFDKFLGDSVTEQLVREVGLDKLLAAATTNNVEETARAQELSNDHPPGAMDPVAMQPPSGSGVPASPAGSNLQVSIMPPPAPAANGSNSSATPTPSSEPDEVANPVALTVDFSPYADINKLGDGEAKQKLRKFEDDLQVAQKELGQAKTTAEGTKRLFEKGFVTKTDMERDEIAYENSRLKVQTAASARDLFLKYDFVKSAEDALSKYAQAVRELDKARRVAVSKAAQAKAKLKSAQGQYEVQSRQRDDLKEQLEKCSLRAKKSGLVVYGASGDDMVFYGGEERIREGASVRERQVILTIPDLSRMSVKVRIHESYIKKVAKGQKARITVDAFPDEVLTGEVTKVGVLPDSQNRWMNPDMKVYLTTITIDGSHDWVKPGMSAKVEILVNHIDDCVRVPVQAVSPDGDKQVCYVAGGLKPERREVQVGDFNDEFIEIKGGLKEGERVLLRIPDVAASEKGNKGSKKSEDKTPDKPGKGLAQPAAAPAPASVQAKKA